MVTYSLTMAEDINVLRNPDNKIVAQNAALKSQHTLMLERTMPYMELKNTSQEGDITSFSMTIGDTSKNFDWSSMIDASPGITFSLQNLDQIAGGQKNDVLTINFTNFHPGDFVRFRTGLSPDDPKANAIMDYRNVFFTMNGGNDTSHNSVVTVGFHTTDGDGTITNTLQNYANNNKFTSTDLALLTTSCGMDSVLPFPSTGGGEVPPVPEPSSLVLLALGLFGASGWKLRSRARRR